MNIAAVIAAFVAGLVGALIWGGIASSTGLQIGWVAWGIGAVVGGASVMFGGRGQTNGVICAAIVVLSILCGKLMGLSGQLDQQVKTELVQPLFKSQKSEARAFAKLKSKKEYKAFMVEHELTEKSSAKKVKNSEVDDFIEDTVPRYEELNEGMTFDEFCETEEVEHFVEMLKSQVSLSDHLGQTFSVFSVLFILLGIGSAFKIGSQEQ